MKYVVAIIANFHTNYIAEGKNFVAEGSMYVPLTERIDEAKRYKTRAIAERASNRSGENMWGRKEIIEVEK